MDEAEYCNRLALINQGLIVAMGTPTEIKHLAIKGALLLVECNPLGRALAVVKQAPGVIDASVFGASLHVAVDAARQPLTELPAFLASHEVQVDRIELISPSLEDAFVSLTGDRTSSDEAAL